jgi:pyruvate,water dikinase
VDAEDVLFLLPEEVEGQTGEPGLASRAAERRSVWQQWAGKRPPTTIGGETSPIAGPAANDAGNLRGIGASRGQTTGWARILSDPAEGERLKPGDVLVCFMTSPAWTPLFGIASAVVTESGGLLSHSAIAAREYGIPCVVGVRGATERICDGALITVDGTAGTVRLVE